MADLKQQIFFFFSSLEESVIRLRGVAMDAGKQTDLEVAILTEQVKSLRAKNAEACEKIEKSMDILKKLK